MTKCDIYAMMKQEDIHMESKNKRNSSKKQVLENYLISEIGKGNLKVGDKIPSEAELVELFHFGRQTVHNTLAELAVKGIIERIPGKGSFVSSRPVNRNIQKKMSFTEDMQSIGKVAGSTLLEFRIVTAHSVPVVAKELNLSPKETLYLIARLRSGNGTPIALQYTYIPTKYLPNPDLNSLVSSVDAYIKKCGIEVNDFITRLRAIEGNEEQLRLLQSSSHALLNSISVRYSDKNTPIHYTSSFYRSELYEYTFSSFS